MDVQSWHDKEEVQVQFDSDSVKLWQPTTWKHLSAPPLPVSQSHPPPPAHLMPLLPTISAPPTQLPPPPPAPQHRMEHPPRQQQLPKRPPPPSPSPPQPRPVKRRQGTETPSTSVAEVSSSSSAPSPSLAGRQPKKLPAPPQLLCTRPPLKGMCCVSQCCTAATKLHPIVNGVQVCEAHYSQLLLSEERTTSGCCPSLRRSGLCQSRGCQLGERRPCCLCGNDDGPTPCTYPGCTAYMCNSCRSWLARRVCVYWDGPKQWFWGTVDEVQDANASMERMVRYDDGEDQEEDLDEMASKAQVRWLVSGCEWHGDVAACVCYPGVAKLDCALVDAMWTCAICQTYDTNLDEHGDLNVMVLCDECHMPVHIFCYGQTRHGDEFRNNNAERDTMVFKCDVCVHRAAGGQPPTCDLCARGGGALREHFDQNGRSKGWVHVGCVWFNHRVGWKVGKQPMSCLPDKLCSRRSGCVQCLRSRVELEPQHSRGSGSTRRCTVGSCPNPTANIKALIECGGCKKAAHVSCGQAIGSGWHIQMGLGAAEALGTTVPMAECVCSSCYEVYLDRSKVHL